MNGNEWDLDESYFDSMDYDVDIERETSKTEVSNDDFIIHSANEIDFRTYIIKELNRINSILSTNKEVLL